MDAVVQTLRDLLEQSVEAMKSADLTKHNLITDPADGEPFIGGPFDVKDGWETAVMIVKNQSGVTAEVRMGFEITGEKIRISPLVSAWYQSAPFGSFPTHTFATRESDEPLYNTELGAITLPDLIDGALAVANLIKPEDLPAESWANTIIPDPAEGEGTDRSENASES